MPNRRVFVQGAIALAGLPVFSTHASGESASPTSPPRTPTNSAAAVARGDAFLVAVQKGDTATVLQMLDEAPHLLYARDAQGQSAYLLAAYGRHNEVMAELEKRGLRLDVYELSAAAKIEDLKTVLHGRGSQILGQNACGDTPLHVAAKAGAAATLDNTIAYGPNFDVANDAGETIAHISVACPEASAAESMTFATIGNAADPHAATKTGDTVLHYAVRNGDRRVVTLLLQKGADPQTKNSAGQSAVDVARASGHGQLATLMTSTTIARDFYGRRYTYNQKFEALTRDDTNGIPKEFVNAFVMYSHFSLPQVQRWITQCPDLLNTRASWDELSVEAAAHMGRKDIGDLMLNRGAAYSLPTATVFGSLADVKRMVSEEPRSLHERGAHSFPLLFYTAFGEPRIETAEYLIGRGVDAKEDMRGRTVLHVAAASGHVDLCRFFVEQGLDPNAVGESFLGSQSAIKAARDAGHDSLATMLSQWARLSSL